MSATFSSSPPGGLTDCARAGDATVDNATSRTATNAPRMTGPLCEMEFDLYGDTGIDGHSLAACRFEANLFGGANGGLVKAVPQLSKHAQDTNLVRCREFDLENNGALDSERLGFVGVTRLWLEQNFDRRVAEGSTSGDARRDWRRRRSHLPIKSARGDNRRRQRANRSSRGGIAKSRGHDRCGFARPCATGGDSLERAHANRRLGNALYVRDRDRVGRRLLKLGLNGRRLDRRRRLDLATRLICGWMRQLR